MSDKIRASATFSTGGLLVLSLMFANFLNFGFNALLGRVLSFEEFGFVTLINTFSYLINIFLGALTTTINRHVAYLSTNQKDFQGKSALFVKSLRHTGLFVSFLATTIWIVLIWQLSYFFKVADPMNLFLFSPFILFGVTYAIERGFLQGTLQFKYASILILAESISKLLIAVVLMVLDLNHWIFVSIPLSIVVTFVIIIFLRGKTKNPIENVSTFKDMSFPKSYYFASLLTGFSTYAFLTFDVLLAKHFLDPVVAGQYALLSLVGKMVYFFGSLFNSFIVTFVGRSEGERKNSTGLFYKFFAGTAFLTLNSFILLGPLGFISVPFLLGDKANSIVPYLTNYTLAIALFTLTNTVIAYHLAKKHYIFPAFSILICIGMIVGIYYNHNNISSIATVVLMASFVSFLITTMAHLLFDQGKFVLKNVIDLIDLFQPISFYQPPVNDKKNILVFNWRDTRHSQAGGAEVYIHELAKRWVTQGHHVTLFCGNDGLNKRYEVVDGIRIIRRGGFFFVYIWAFLYYLKHFRRKFDVIIDCQNGIPFFTPLYVKESVYCVMHHVHQDVFSQYLSKPFAMIARYLEKDLMPSVYKNMKFISVSESTKAEMIELGISPKNIEIVHNGVDLDKLNPGKKTKEPTILYLGRLKAYKSIDILLEAFKKVYEQNKNVTLIIAGTGDEELKLKKKALELGINDKVNFKGRVSDKEKINLLQESWVLVNPSFKEGWGITTIEANACGTPVVASNVPGLRESVKDQETGILVEYGNSEKLASAIELLIDNQSTREEMITSAINWANNFDWNISAEKGLRLII